MLDTKSSGFTLIEILIALVILAIAMLAVMKVMRDSIRNFTHLEEVTAAHWVAMNVLTEIQSGMQPAPSADNETKGSFQMLNRNWQWQAKITQAGSHYYQQITIKVFQHDHELTELHGFLTLPGAQ